MQSHCPLPPYPVTSIFYNVRFVALTSHLLLTVFLLTGCAVGPNYARPTVAIPAQFKEAAIGWKIAQPNDQSDRGPWWECFNDPQLNALITRGNASNQEIAGYEARYREARALVAQVRSHYFPVVNLSSSMARTGAQQPSSSGIGDPSRGNSVRNAYDMALDASWEPDVWGKVRRQARGQGAHAQSAEAELANMRLSIQTTLAQDYFQLRALDAQKKLLDDTVAAYQQSLKLTQNRYEQGVITQIDTFQAQTQLQQARAAAIDNRIARAQFEHAIATLVGEPASTFSIPPTPLKLRAHSSSAHTSTLRATLPQIPLQLPSVLLERRPDIAFAERKMAAANEQIGVALAGFFPSLSLSASGGFQSTVFSQWLTAPARVWSLGPQLAATLFDAGLRRAQTQAARKAYDQTVAHYRQTVLFAFQEVEDALVELRLLESEAAVQQQLVKYAQQALAMATREYTAGTANYLEVITAQTTALSAKRNVMDITRRRMLATVTLIKALGGEWNAS